VRRKEPDNKEGEPKFVQFLSFHVIKLTIVRVWINRSQASDQRKRMTLTPACGLTFREDLRGSLIRL